MKKRVIVLADNSYTIRRIVELSFSEIEDVEIISFESGIHLKDKLLEIKPAVVIVDVKLPVVSGYEICKFVNQSEALKKTRVYLMKGSFEPLNQELSKDLHYEEIITKPFDSNQVVSAVMNILGQQDEPDSSHGVPEDVPITIPEDFSAMETENPVVEINFADVHEDFLPKATGVDGRSRKSAIEDDILPSEEITQGTQPSKDDLLAPETEESLYNPFENEPAPEPKPSVELREHPVEEDKLTALSGDDTSESIGDLSLSEAKSDPEEGDRFPGDFLKEMEKKEAKESGGSQGISTASDKPDTEMLPFGDEGEFPGEDGFIGGKIDNREFFVAEQQEPEPAAAGPNVDAQEKQPLLTDLAALNKEAIAGKMEDKLTLAIKELLWDIIPPLAERIIKEEIEKIKSDMNKPE